MLRTIFSKMKQESNVAVTPARQGEDSTVTQPGCQVLTFDVFHHFYVIAVGHKGTVDLRQTSEHLIMCHIDQA